MISIIGTLIGLLGSFIPKILDIWKLKEDHKHELAILHVQAEMAKQQHLYRMEEVKVQADIASEQAVYRQATVKYSGVKWVDGLLALYQGTIRPTITYMFTIGYFIVKYAQYKVITATGDQTVWEIIWKLWNSEDMAAFMTIIGFWFGGRLLKSNLAFFAPTPTIEGPPRGQKQLAPAPQKPRKIEVVSNDQSDSSDINIRGY